MLSCNLTHPVIVTGVRGGTAAVDLSDLPVTLHPGEVFTCQGTLSQPGQTRIQVEYEVESIGPATFAFMAPFVKTSAPWLVFKLDAPATTVRFQPFTIRIGIENPSGEMTSAVFEVAQTTAFLTEGQTRKTISLFGSQTKAVKMTFRALEAGSMMLPQISFTEAGDESKRRSKTFLAPIVVTFQ
jgi:hypothetical protein